MNSLRKTFLQELAQVYDAEELLLQVLPRMARAAVSPELSEAFEVHLGETEEHLSRLIEVFHQFEEPAQSQPSLPMELLVQTVENGIRKKAGDAALLSAALQIEHYEMAAYSSLYILARLLRQPQAVSLLHRTLLEERLASEQITTVGDTSLYAHRQSQEEPVAV